MDFASSEFYCTQCGQKGITIMRKSSHYKKSGHLKKLYCIHCKQQVNHVEIRERGEYTLEDFLTEFRLGRFVDGQRIELKDLKTCDERECPYNCEGKCWNANGKNNCQRRNENE